MEDFVVKDKINEDGNKIQVMPDQKLSFIYHYQQAGSAGLKKEHMNPFYMDPKALSLDILLSIIVLGFDYRPVYFLSAIDWKANFPFLPSAVVHETPSRGWLEVVFSLGIIRQEFKRLQCFYFKNS